MDDGLGGTFVEVVGFTTPYTLNSFLITSTINSGRNYSVRYRVANVHGWSDFSPVTLIRAATVPSIPVGEPETSIPSVETNVHITWTAPTSTGGSGIVISAYIIQVMLKDGSYVTVCDGTDPQVVSSTACTLPALSFIHPPFSFIQGDKIKARVAAVNEIGSSEFSVVSSTTIASVQTTPHKPTSLIQVN